MFYIINVTTGEVINKARPADQISDALRFLASIGYALDNVVVQADCASGFNITALEWLGIV